MAAQRKKALGKGLDALFGEMNVSVSATRNRYGETETERDIVYVDVNNVKPNAMQPRKDFNEEALRQLAESIKAHGVIQPVMLRKNGQGYELVAGERRWRAARKAGLKEVPAIVRDLNEEENALFAIIENMQREDLNPMEEAAAFKNIMTAYGMTQEAVSQSVGKSRSHIANTLRLLKLPQDIREMIVRGDFTLGHANAIGAIKDAKRQTAVARQIVRESLSVREAEILAAKELGKSVSGKGRRAKPRMKNEEIRSMEEELTGLLGTKVAIGNNGKNTIIEIHCYSRAVLEGVIDELRALGR
ncbi:MAG: ParB/RepB/Spo0J family partition protein [Clostridiales Family XIII bacterium]|jgi:ParB family chromosome partitioning protein|nr:ParB/RepB/Spo0J family partition protein [Clostridiales Family XIII bacterium]